MSKVHSCIVGQGWGISHQSQVVVGGLLLHRGVLGEVDEVGADGLWVRLHVDGLQNDIITSGKLQNTWLGLHDVHHCFSPFCIYTNILLHR